MNKELRSPVTIMGGKCIHRSRIVPILERIPHRIYVEPFGGGASILFAKEPAEIEVYNDIDSGLVNFFRVLRDPDLFHRFYHKAILTPYSREEYYHCRESWEQQEDIVERAYQWYIVSRFSFGGCFGKSWGFSTNTTLNTNEGKMSMPCARWLSILSMLPLIHKRFMRVQVEHCDFSKIFKLYDSPDTLFYCDPPYILSTRKDGYYKHEMSEQDHEELVSILLNIKGKAALSCYDHPIYQPLKEAGWEYNQWQTSAFLLARTKISKAKGAGAAQKKSPRIECLFVKPYQLPDQQLNLL